METPGDEGTAELIKTRDVELRVTSQEGQRDTDSDIYNQHTSSVCSELQTLSATQQPECVKYK